MDPKNLLHKQYVLTWQIIYLTSLTFFSFYDLVYLHHFSVSLLEHCIIINGKIIVMQVFIADYFFKSKLAENFSHADIQVSIY